MSKQIITITGATGNIGHALVHHLLASGHVVRVIGRSAERLSPLVSQGAEAYVGDQLDTAFLTGAFAGATAVFGMIPPSYGEPDFRAYQQRSGDALARAIEVAQVPRAVALSSVGAHLAEGNGPIAGLYDLEHRLATLSGLHLAVLRPAYFLENHLHGLGMIRGMGVYGGAARGDVALPMVATADIAAFAADLLHSASFTGHSLHYLLGAADYTLDQAAKALGAAVGKPELSWVQFPEDEVRKALLGMGMSADVTEKFVEMERGFSSGLIQPTEARTAANTNPTSLAAWAEQVFRPAYHAAG